MSTTDQVTLEILTTKFTAIAEEMGITLQRTGRTIYVRETADFGTALVSRGGEFFGFPRNIGVVGFVGLNCKPVIEAFDDLEPGDVILTNDPYASGGLSTHLPDLHLIRPYFFDGELVCYGWCFVHSADIGGRVPSSISPTNTSIYQEGLAIPPVRIVKKGQLDRDVVAIYRANCRTADMNWGDIQAMLASLEVGQKRISEIAEEYGVEAAISIQEDVLSYSEHGAREVLKTIPDGVYTFWDYLDDDVGTAVPVRIRTALTVSDGLIHIDFTGTDPQTAGPYNIATGGAVHPWLVLRVVAFAHSHAPQLPVNGGILRNVTVNVPERTVVNPVKPAAVGIRIASGLRVFDAIGGALAQACPGGLPACPAGTVVPMVLVEPNEGRGRESKVGVVQFMVGGTGARDGADGMDGRDPGLSSMANNPIEIVEAETSVTILDYGVRPDAGGPGRFRGGCGQMFRFRVERDGCTVLARGLERMRFRPWGLDGGRPGAGLEIYRTDPGGRRTRLGKVDELAVNRGDIVEILMPGGGGYGDPLERDPEAVARDVVAGFVSREAARTEYKVVVDGGAVDHAATLALRGAGRGAGGPAGQFGFDEQRLRWDAVFPDDIQSAVSERLRTLPADLAQRARRTYYEAISPALVEEAGRTRSLLDLLRDVSPDRVGSLPGGFDAAYEGTVRTPAPEGGDPA